MITRLTELQVDRVLAGCTVTGKPQHTPIRFPNDRIRRANLYHWIDDTFHSPGPRLSVKERTALIRKFAHFTIRSNNLGYGQILNGLQWFRNHPHLLTTNLSFAGAAKHAEEAHRHEHNKRTSCLLDMVLKDSAAPCAPPPVIFDDGAYLLQRLVHPLHLRDVGGEANNCLSYDHQGEKIANPNYWDEVKCKELSVYALRHHKTLCLVFSVFGGEVDEYDPFHDDWYTHVLLDRCQTALGLRPPPDNAVPEPEPPCDRAVFTRPRHDPEHLSVTIERAILGDVPGSPALKAIPFPKARAAMENFRATLGDFIRLCNGHTDDDVLRFARKLAVYFTRHTQPASGRLIRGTGYFAEHRDALRSNLSFAGAARLQDAMWLRASARLKHQQPEPLKGEHG